MSAEDYLGLLLGARFSSVFLGFLWFSLVFHGFHSVFLGFPWFSFVSLGLENGPGHVIKGKLGRVECSAVSGTIRDARSVFWVKISISDGKLDFRCILRVLGENLVFRWKTRFSVHSACFG